MSVLGLGLWICSSWISGECPSFGINIRLWYGFVPARLVVSVLGLVWICSSLISGECPRPRPWHGFVPAGLVVSVLGLGMDLFQLD